MHEDPIRGRTIRWSYRDGPTVGTTFEHTFAEDGTVTYRMVDGPGAGGAGGKAPAPPAERTRYETVRVRDGVHAVAYLAPSGWTLSTIIDVDSGEIVSFASNEKELIVQSGTVIGT